MRVQFILMIMLGIPLTAQTSPALVPCAFFLLVAKLWRKRKEQNLESTRTPEMTINSLPSLTEALGNL